ncbi:putative AC transposase [Metarhizium anisopliae]
MYGEDIQLKRDGREKFWYCYICEKQHKQQELPIIGKGNSTALDHLETKHNINRATGDLKPLKQTPKDSDQLSISDCNNMKSLVFARRLDHFKELLVRWIVCCHIALFQIENTYFRDMVFYLFPPLGNLLPKAADTIRRWVMDAFEARREKLKHDLREARSSISISFDLWTSPNYLAILGVVAHFIDKNGERRAAVLGLRELMGEHSGENMAELIQGQQTRWNSYFMSIGRVLNVKERIQIFCDQYEPGQGQKDLSEDRLSSMHWKELEHLHDQLETFYEGTMMTEGRNATLADHFQTLDWLLNEIQVAKHKFEELHQDSLRKKRRGAHEAEEFAWLAAAAEVSWRKCEEYFNKADDTAAYYAAISLNPTLKHEWYNKAWSGHDEKRPWIVSASTAVQELWLDEYKGKYSVKQLFPSGVLSPSAPQKDKAFTSVRNHKRLKISHQSSRPQANGVDPLDQFIETDIIPLSAIEGETSALGNSDVLKAEESGNTDKTDVDGYEPQILDHEGLDEEGSCVDAIYEGDKSPHLS